MKKYLLMAILVSCSNLKKVDTTSTKLLDGFQFQLPAGEWFEKPGQPGMYGKKIGDDGSTTLIVVQRGVIYPVKNVLKVKKEILEVFENSLKTTTPGDRVKNVKNTFRYHKYKKTWCLDFTQLGTDGDMPMSNNGRICLHPTDGNHYLWLGFTNRVPAGKELPQTAVEEKFLFDSLSSLKL